MLAAERGDSGDWQGDGKVRKDDLLELGGIVGKQTSTELEGIDLMPLRLSRGWH